VSPQHVELIVPHLLDGFVDEDDVDRAVVGETLSRSKPRRAGDGPVGDRNGNLTARFERFVHGLC
jgi:hypothetical protein